MTHWTLTKLAEDLDVSIATVSLALNGSTRIRPETRERVQAYARKVGYRSNLLARRLRSKSSGLLGCVLPSIASSNSRNLIQHLYLHAFRRGYQLQIRFSENDVAMESLAIQECIDSQVDGLILISCAKHLRDLPKDHPLRQPRNRGFPTVVIGNVRWPFCRVTKDTEGAVREAFLHLVHKGYQKICFLYAFNKDGESQSPCRLVRECATATGFPARRLEFLALKTDWQTLRADDAGQTTQSYFDYSQLSELAYQAASDLLTHCGGPVGYLCRNDLIAGGLYRYCLENEVPVPGLAGICGIDDVAGNLIPLTSVAWDWEGFGDSILDALSAQLEGRKPAPQPKAGFRLRPRHSTNLKV